LFEALEAPLFFETLLLVATGPPMDVLMFWFFIFYKFFAFYPSFEVVIDPGVFFVDAKFLPCFWAPT